MKTVLPMKPIGSLKTNNDKSMSPCTVKPTKHEIDDIEMSIAKELKNEYVIAPYSQNTNTDQRRQDIIDLFGEDIGSVEKPIELDGAREANKKVDKKS